MKVLQITATIEKWSSNAWMIKFIASKTKELIISQSKAPYIHPSLIFLKESHSWNTHIDWVRTSCANKSRITLHCKKLLLLRSSI